MNDDEHRLDGNVVGGLLAEVFPFEMTTAFTTCGSCGNVAQVGALKVYIHGMGAIVRCVACDNLLIRIAHGPGRYSLDLSGMRTLQITAAGGVTAE
ncbi:MAG: hypothetical protein AVDCRST_MAG93-110 [uncultured Chloroflexia bacterium]|uniref:Uncharacterized protein n=1 Tax=uncultured Chloroflexia bacterium TaxID=1672391 RepID=A0A6J4H3E6_9CHLR|nr:MAG: hypothetical protein AVDCRST_MAG93-110 [uncultured Chloroflexia bacterium]